MSASTTNADDSETSESFRDGGTLGQLSQKFVSFFVVLTAAYFASYVAALHTFLNSVWRLSLLGIVKPPKWVPLPTDALNKKDYGTHSHVQLSHVKVHFTQKFEGDNPNKKTLMILIHGSPDFWYSFRENILHFAQTYWVIAVDLRGSGDSERLTGFLPSRHYKLRDFSDDVKNLIEALGRKKAILVGHEFGGTIIYDFILRYPNYVEKYVAINSAPSYGIGKSRTLVHMWFQFFSIFPILPELYLAQHDLCFLEKKYDKEKLIVRSYKFIFSRPGILTTMVECYRANIVTLTHRILFGIDGLEKLNLPKGLAIYGDRSAVSHAKAFHHDIVPGLTPCVLEDSDERIHEKKSASVHNKIDKFLQTVESETVPAKPETLKPTPPVALSDKTTANEHE